MKCGRVRKKLMAFHDGELEMSVGKKIALLERIIGSKTTPNEMRGQALRTLGELDKQRAVKLAKGLYGDPSPEVARAAQSIAPVAEAP